MEILIIVTVLAILVETTYLVYQASRAHKSQSNNDIVLDTSALIDGRILEIVRSGLVSSRLVIPRSVVRELQFMADKADHDKRERARYGLDVIEKLQELPDSNVNITDDGLVSEHGVDEQLILLAQRSGAKLCTVDYNLNKAARVQSVEIVNINELAHALRVVHLPGENQDILLVQTGQDKKQAVGYLDDGTMVVVDDAREYIGKSVNVSFTRVLQTAAGRMMFARRSDAGSAKPRANTDAPTRSRPVKKQSTSSPRRQSSRRRPSSPEDTLVNLANE